MFSSIITIAAISGFAYKYRTQIFQVVQFFSSKKIPVGTLDVVNKDTALVSTTPKMYEIVKSWEELRTLLNAAGLSDSVKAMDEVFLNLITKENTAKKVR